MGDVLSNTLIIAHVATGSAALVLGALALFSRKGFGLHVVSGRGFAALMVCSSAFGAILGVLKPDQFLITFFAGVLATYLIASGWLSARMRNSAGAGSAAAGLVNAANVAALVWLGTEALGTETGTLRGFAGEDYLFLAGMGGIALAADLTLLLRRRLGDRARIARHLWRMSLGFFIAAGSAFTGPGASAFPEALQQSGILSAPELIIIVMMLGYLVRTWLFPRRA